ncbi:hypothetical protein D9615_003197 [Tricholomella constricta]|uniref:Uncharacterized protein n=1 Tax=Tricholomella constricta TaxID=117010 RepID=A0A8H5M7Q9_9AGAR|nr:hypothetical protein D9615_003197 [Tricholomella constricta]
MGRWTQFDEDSYRLPEGMKRIGYDADTKVYTFRDRAGTLYRGAPGADYGTLTPIPSSNAAASSRPGAFASDSPQQASSDNPKERTSTFHDILPANRITATTSPVDKSPLSPRSPRFSDDGDRPSPRAQFADAVRRTALPKMQGVVDNLRLTSTESPSRFQLMAAAEEVASCKPGGGACAYLYNERPTTATTFTTLPKSTMHIRRAAVPVIPETDTPSSSLALLPLLSIVVLVLIVLFFAVRLFKRSFHLPSLTWLRGKGQGAKGRLGLSGVELLPTSLKSIPTPKASPYAASFTLEGNAGKIGGRSTLSRSSSLDGLPPSGLSTPLPPSTSPRSRSQFALPAFFKSKRRSLHRRSKSLGLPARHLIPPSNSLMTGNSAPSTPQSPLIDFSTSNSSTSTSSDLGTHKFSSASPPLIPGIPIPVLNPAPHSTYKPHTFPTSSHVWAFDLEEDAEGDTDSNVADPLLAAFKRTQSPPKSLPEPQPLIHYDRCSSPPLHAPPTPALAPKRLGTANPFASLIVTSASPTYLTHPPLSPSPLSLSPSSPPGIELVSIKPTAAYTPPSSANLVDFDADVQLDVTEAACVVDSMVAIAVLGTPTASPTGSELVEPIDTDARDLHEAQAESFDARAELVADPFDDVHGIILSEDAWDIHLSPVSSAEDALSPAMETPPQAEQPQLQLSGPSSPIISFASPVATSSPVAVPASLHASPDVEPKSLTASWQWDDAWSPAPLPVPSQTSGWPLGSVSIGVEDQDEDEPPMEKEADLISFGRDAAAEGEVDVARGSAKALAVEVDAEPDPADAWFVEEPTAVWDTAWSGESVKSGSLFAKGMEDEEQEVQIRFLDELLAGPSEPVEIRVTEEIEEKILATEEPAHDDQEDEHHDINDIHDAIPPNLTVASTTALTTTSLLSTPTTPSTPLPSLPLPSIIMADPTSVEEHPDPDLLPLPAFPLPLLALSPAPLSPQPLKALSPVYPLSPAQTPTPPASPPPIHNVPTRPLWSLRAADAPPLGIPASAMVAPVPAAPVVLVTVVPEATTPVMAEVERESHVAPGDVIAPPGVNTTGDPSVGVLINLPTDEPQETLKEETPHNALSLSESIPGSFPTSPSPPPAPLPAPAPAHLSPLPRAIASSPSSPPASTSSASTVTPSATRAGAIQQQNRAGSNRLRTPRSALDLALAMQLRPGLGAGADPAWMVRFLMALFGWVAVLVSGDV